MSIQKVKSKAVWRVRWRHAGQHRSQTFYRFEDAKNFEADLRLRAQRGQLEGLDSGRIALDTYMADTWVPTYASGLAPNTRRLYQWLYHHHLSPYLGDIALRDLTPEVIARWQADRLRDGAGPVAVRKALVLLGSVLQRAVEGRHIPTNAQRVVRSARQPRRHEVRPLAPATVEAMRQAALSPAPIEVDASRPDARRRRAYTTRRPGDGYTRQRDAALISVLAYAGLRPGEALTLTWRDITHRTIRVYAPKTDATRTVRLLAPLAADLREFKMASGRPAADKLIFPDANGRAWGKGTWDSWRKRTFSRLLAAADVEHARPYDLRHSFASLLLHERRSVVYVAKQLGHSPRLTLGTYAHVIDELDEAPGLTADEAIAMARTPETSAECPAWPLSSS